MLTTRNWICWILMQEEIKVAVLIRELHSKVHHLIVELQHQCLQLRRHHHLLSFIHLMGEYPLLFSLKLLIVHALVRGRGPYLKIFCLDILMLILYYV